MRSRHMRYWLPVVSVFVTASVISCTPARTRLPPTNALFVLQSVDGDPLPTRTMSHADELIVADTLTFIAAASGDSLPRIEHRSTYRNPIAPRGGCTPAYPLFYSVGALAGWQWGRGRDASVRALSGAGYYRAVRRDGGGGTIGLQCRIDLATAALWRVALIGSLRGAVLPSFRGDAHGLGTASFGVRVH